MRWALLPISILGCAAIILSAAQDGLPEGKGKDAFAKICASCHQLDQVTNHKYPKSRWADIVDDMVSRGAESTDEETKSIVSYLSRNYGRPLNINTSSAKEITAGLGFPTAQAEVLVQYRIDNGTFKTYEDLAKVPGLDAGLLDEEKKNIQF
jgi:competence ComEA-like helix-hairpin-helix protein